MNSKAYLERIDYQGPLLPSAETLRRLQLAHLLAVPFENLSIHNGEPVVLDDVALFDKIVRRRRGGFCYELNGLFAALMRDLGFQVTMVSAAVMGGGGEFGPPFDHMALVVSLEERWLVDVGFGDAFREPLRLDERGEQVQGTRGYRIDLVEDCYTLWQHDGDGDWSVQYRFDLTPYTYADYGEMCRYHQTSPQSHFTQRRVCTRATPGGRITLSELRLITTSDGVRQERQLPDESHFRKALRERFGITEFD